MSYRMYSIAALFSFRQRQDAPEALETLSSVAHEEEFDMYLLSYNRVDPPRVVLTKCFIQQKRYNICIQEVKQTILKGHITLKHFTNVERAWRPRHLPKMARVAAGKF